MLTAPTQKLQYLDGGPRERKWQATYITSTYLYPTVVASHFLPTRLTNENSMSNGQRAC